MEIISSQIAYAKSRPMLVGLFAVLATLSVGVALAFATGLVSPDKIMAQVLPPCCTIVTPPPVIIVPPPTVILPPIDVLPPCCTTVTPPPTVVVPPVDTTPDVLPPCCTETNPPVTTNPPIDTTPPDVLPPCCTETEPPITTEPPIVIPPIVIPPIVTDFCPNLPNNQTILPDGYILDENGNCVTPPDDFCPNLPGLQGSLPPGYYVDENGNCVTRTTDAAPECIYLAASLGTITTPGQAVTLSWKTRNATGISINNGVGSVTPVAEGSVVVYPTGDTTYVATVTGTSGSVNCQTVVVLDTEPAPECVFFSATPGTITTPGQAVTLAWQTRNATSVVINNGVGSVSPVGNGSVVVNPTQSTTYTATVSGVGGTVHCQAPVTLTTVEQPSAQCIAFTGTPTAIRPGEAVTLAWQTRNATGISIDNGVGPVSPIAQGSVVVNPTQTTTYTATVSGVNGPVNCQTTVTVSTVEEPPAQCVFFNGTPNVINAGDAVNLSWKTLNAGTVTINNGVGQVSAEGSTTVRPTQNTTYILSATGAKGTVHCQTSVTLTTIEQKPMCVSLKADRTTIRSGEAVTLSWVTNDASSVSIDNGIGQVLPTAAGSYVVNPTSNTTYTATVPGSSLNQNCQVRVEIESTSCTSNCGGGGGGGRRSPRVLLDSISEFDEPLSFVYLSETPYTGLELGTWGTILYWMMLIGWSLALAYLVLFNAVPFALARAKAFGSQVQETMNSGAAPAHGHDTHTAPVAHAAHAPAPAHHGHAPAHHDAHAASAPAKPTGFNASEGFRSFAAGEGLTIDDIVKGLSRQLEENKGHGEHAPVAPVVAAPTHEEVLQAVHEAPAPAPAPVYVPAPVAAAVPAMAPLNADVHEFLAALLRGDRDTVFGMIRSMARQGHDTETFVSHAACALDDAYRACIDGTTCHPDIAALTAGCHPSYLERLVSSLTTAVDGSYSAGMTGVKMALTRALGVVAG